MATISLATNDADIARCFPVMAQLRPHLVEKEFVPLIQRLAREHRYELAFAEEAGRVECVGGFRMTESLYYGKFLYVDDLVTSESARCNGYGGLLLDWLIERARKNGCASVALDSGVQRFAAHRFYLRKRMEIACHHFALKLR